MKAYIPEDLIDVIKSARYNPPFEVIDMTQFCFWSIKEATDMYLNTSKLQISQAAAIRIEKQNPAMVKIKTTVSDLVPWEEVIVLKKGKTVSNIRNAELRVLSPENKISENKKKSLLSMIPYLRNLCIKSFIATYWRLPVPWLLFGIIYGEPVQVNSVGMVCSITILFMMLLFVIMSIACFRWKMNKGLGFTMFLLYFVFVAVSLMFEYNYISCPF
nr:unnamed protein product [Callosobruchus analis]